MTVGLAATADGVMVVDGVMSMLAVMVADGAADMAVDMRMVVAVMVVAVMAVADMLRTPTQDTAAAIAADLNGHRISPAQSCSVTFDVHPSALS